MSLNLNDIESPNTGSNKLCPAGNHRARVVSLIDMGVHNNFFDSTKPPKPKVSVTYELLDEFMDDEETKPFWVSETFALSHPKADLGTSTKRMKAIDPANELNFDISKIVGLPCTVTVVHEPKKDNPSESRIKISNVTPAMKMKGMTMPELVNAPRLFLLATPDLEVFNGLPDWMKEDIKKNNNYQGSPLQAALNGGATPKAKVEPMPQPEHEEAAFDDEIPF